MVLEVLGGPQRGVCSGELLDSMVMSLVKEEGTLCILMQSLVGLANFPVPGEPPGSLALDLVHRVKFLCLLSIPVCLCLCVYSSSSQLLLDTVLLRLHSQLVSARGGGG